jgi:hypothetical protein
LWHETLGLLLALVNEAARNPGARLPLRYPFQTVSALVIATRIREAIPAATSECANPDHPWHQIVRTLPQEIGSRLERDHVALARCVLGNPFRPLTFDPAWRTDTARAMARQMYDAREFSAMPILADALQDAGCDDEAVLSHCRVPGPHVRGCCVVGCVLGTS